jgi:hypothetical protein
MTSLTTLKGNKVQTARNKTKAALLHPTKVLRQ